MISKARIPLVTLLLIIVNLLAAFGFLLNPDLVEQWGFVTRQTPFYKAPISIFLHANTVHLLGNMVFLAAVGVAVELATGSLRFLAVYILSGLAGIAVYAIATRSMVEPPILVGASGAIAGCAAYYGFRYTKMKVPIAPKLGLSVAWIIGVWFVLQLLGAFVKLGAPVSGTAFLAHAGGFVAGLLLAVLFKAPDFAELSLGHKILDQMNDRGPDAVIVMAERHLSRHPGDLKALWQLADAHHELGHSKEESEALLKIWQSKEGSVEENRSKVAPRIAVPTILNQYPLIGRMKVLEKLGEHLPAAALAVFADVRAGDKSTPNRADALLMLTQLLKESSPTAAAESLEILRRDYPVHDATLQAKQRGLF